MELTCSADSSASISKAEPISIFCTDAQCENIASAYDRESNNDVIIEDNFENEGPRASHAKGFALMFSRGLCKSGCGRWTIIK